MTFDEAVKNMIKEYWEGDSYDEAESFKKATYNKKYFSSLEEEKFPKVEKLEKPKGKSK